MGTISQTGVYTAPNAGGVAFVYAQPVGSTTSFASVIYISQGFGTNVGPGTTTLGTGSTGTGTTVLPYPSAGSSPSPAPLPVSTAPQPLPTQPSVSPFPTQPAYPALPASGNPTPSISISISPASISLQAGQSAMFNALLQGTANAQVQWTLNPSIGTISNGYYTAPSGYFSEAQITISATSLANPAKTATATVLLAQPI